MKKIFLFALSYMCLYGGIQPLMAQADTSKPAAGSSHTEAASPNTGGGGCGLGQPCACTPPPGSLIIQATHSQVCNNTSVTFTISSQPSTSGWIASWNWSKNGVSVGSGTTYTNASWSNGDVVRLQLNLTGKIGCTGGAGFISNAITMTILAPATPSGPTGSAIGCDGVSGAYFTFSNNATSYNWTVSPPDAATITNGNTSDATVTWASNFSGVATLSVTGTGCGITSAASSLTVTGQAPASTPSAPAGSTTLCQGGSAVYTTSAANASSYNWTLNGSAIAGTGASNTISFPAGLTGSATIGVSANGCSGATATATTTVNITPTVGAPGAPSGSTSLCQGSAPQTYFTGGATNATGYTWLLTPSSAGSISGSGTSAVVSWNGTFNGTATVGVIAAGCNASGIPANTAVTIVPTVGTPSAPSGPVAVSTGTQSSTYTTGASNASGYSWLLTPAQAGTLSASGNIAIVSWDASFVGTAVVSVSANGCSGPSAQTTTSVILYPPLNAGTVTPAALTIASGSDPGLLTASSATGGNCSGSYQYQWLVSTDGVNYSNATGTSGSENYDPGILSAPVYYKRRVICGTDTVYTNPAKVLMSTGSASTDLNYIRTRTLSKPLVTDTVTADGLSNPADVQQITQYFDGLGRPIQTVSKQMTPLGKDLVVPQVYDPFGREVIHYLPYASLSSDGNYKPNALAEQNSFNSSQFPGEQFYYGQTDLESSPLSRPLNVYPAGLSWVGSGHGAGTEYEVNRQFDSVALWNIAAVPGSLPVMAGRYPAGQLYKNIITDEAGHQTVEYKDMSNQIILKKVQLSGTPGTAHAGWLCTYYVYDDMNLLRFVISPRAVELINTGAAWTMTQPIADELCFRYEYDSRRRVIVKKVPGTGETHMVYDIRDRLVMSQDSMLRSNKQWLVSYYDTQNRPDSTGILTDAANYNNLSFHTNLAASSSYYPPVSSYPFNLQTQTYYDDYAWVTALGNSLVASMDMSRNSNPDYFFTSFNSLPGYALPLTPHPITHGMLTGIKRQVIGTTQFLYDVNFYDDRGRVLQVESSNSTNGIDYETNQYNFSGKPLRHLLVEHKNGAVGQGHIAVSQYTYDPAFRMTGVKVNDDGSGLTTVDTLKYNELGQLRTKVLGGGIDSLVYDYNIRTWLTGINKNYVAGTSTNYFGMELGYDKQASVSTTTYSTAQFNGNIAGLIWKSAGDGINRKYDFTYDNVNRLSAANFQQNPSGSTWNAMAMDYSVSIPDYDANGNILHMNQKGFKVGAPTGLIDQLSYTYQSNSNKLSQVADASNDTASVLGDFHYKGTKQSFDYLYDGNGNLRLDNNKGIDSIGYNYLNLPQYIHINGKGTIVYSYDAAGMKLTKVVTDSTQVPVKANTTYYIKAYQYLNDTLQQFNHEEGRIRWQKKYLFSGDSVMSYFYDFFEKDHLGNTRVILTQQKDTALYTATMEAAARAKEMALFYNIDSTSIPTTSVPGGYPADGTPLPNDSLAVVSGSVGRHTMGPAILLKVMSGDSISFGVKSYYVGSGPGGSNTNSLPGILNALAGGLAGMSGVGHGALTTLENPSSPNPLYAALNSFLPSMDTVSTGKPKAYLNWMLLDNQFNYVSDNGQSGAMQVGNAGVLATLATAIKLHHSGFLYIWVSNETQNWDVFFNNLSVETFSGPLLEEDHYYPFGLTMAGISDKALKTQYAQNKYRYNGKELQSQEFSDGSGLEEYDYGARMYDQQIGRWNTQDKFSEVYVALTPYQYAANNPVKIIDQGGNLLKDKDGNIIATSTGQVYTRSQDVTLDGKNYKVDATYNEVVVYTDAGTPVRALQLVNQTVQQQNDDGSYSVTSNSPVDASQNCNGTTFANASLVIVDQSKSNESVNTILSEDGYSADTKDPNIFTQKGGGDIVHSGKINSDGSITSDHDLEKPQVTTLQQEKDRQDADVKVTTYKQTQSDPKVATDKGTVTNGVRLVSADDAQKIRKDNGLKTTTDAKGTIPTFTYKKQEPTTGN